MHTDPIAFFLTWTCYGTWLPGDERGSTRWHRGYLPPRPLLEDWCRQQMRGEPVWLNKQQRQIVVQAITDHCQHRAWHLHEVDCHTNHVHVVVTASEYRGEAVRDQFKSWCTRRLNEYQRSREAAVPVKWWTKGGSVRPIFNEDDFEAACQYVREAQDKGGSKANE